MPPNDVLDAAAGRGADRLALSFRGCDLHPSDTEVFDLLRRAEPPKSLWGVSPVAPLHLGYDSLFARQRHLPRHCVLLADFHAILTHGFSRDAVNRRAHYYEYYMRECCGLEVQFVRGSEFQSRTDYIEPLFALLNEFGVAEVKSHLPVIVRSTGDGKVSVGAYVYALMQCLDASYLEADLLFGEAGQKKIYSLLADLPPKVTATLGRIVADRRTSIDFRARPAVYLPTGSDIAGEPLIKSTSRTRIHIHETRETLAAKVRQMYAPAGGQPVVPGRLNALLAHFEHSVFPWRKTPVVVRDDHGNSRAFEQYTDLEAAYLAGELHPRECKDALVESLWDRLSAVQHRMNSLSGWVDVARL